MPDALMQWLMWLEETSVGTGIRESLWTYPLLHFGHILGNSLMFGTIVFLDLRLLGLGLTKRRVSDVAAQILPWTWVGWSVMFVTGGFIFTSDAVRFATHPFFQGKMALMLLAGLNAGAFHWTVFRGVEKWDVGVGTPLRARVAGAVSILTWIGILATGRWIGYSGY